MLAIREYVSQAGSLDPKDVKRVAIGKRHFDAAFEKVRRSPEFKRDTSSPPPMVA